MRIIRAVFLSVLVCLWAAVGGSAQLSQIMRPPSMQGIWGPVVGTGAAYEIQNKNQRQTVEMTIVGKETVAGKDAYWLEYGIQDPRSARMMYMKILVSQDQNNVITERMVFQVPGQPQPMEMSTQIQANDINRAQGADVGKQEADIRKKAEHVGTETITVPAGTFVCEHYRMSEGSGADAWISPKVSPWGVVKVTGPENSMTLVKTITGAKDHITGTPVKFDPMQMMRQTQKP